MSKYDNFSLFIYASSKNSAMISSLIFLAIQGIPRNPFQYQVEKCQCRVWRTSYSKSNFCLQSITRNHCLHDAGHCGYKYLLTWKIQAKLKGKDKPNGFPQYEPKFISITFKNINKCHKGPSSGTVSLIWPYCFTLPTRVVFLVTVQC